MDTIVSGKESFSNLANILDELISEYNKLFFALTNLTTAIKESNPDVFMETHKHIETIVLKIRLLEELRLKHIKNIAYTTGFEESTISLTMLSQLSPSPLNRRFLFIREKLNDTIIKVGEKIKHSSRLLEGSIASIENTLNFIKSLCSTNPIYMRSGKIESTTGSNSFFAQKV